MRSSSHPARLVPRRQHLLGAAGVEAALVVAELARLAEELEGAVLVGLHAVAALVEPRQLEARRRVAAHAHAPEEIGGLHGVDVDAATIEEGAPRRHAAAVGARFACAPIEARLLGRVGEHPLVMGVGEAHAAARCPPRRQPGTSPAPRVGSGGTGAPVALSTAWPPGMNMAPSVTHPRPAFRRSPCGTPRSRRRRTADGTARRPVAGGAGAAATAGGAARGEGGGAAAGAQPVMASSASHDPCGIGPARARGTRRGGGEPGHRRSMTRAGPEATADLRRAAPASLGHGGGVRTIAVDPPFARSVYSAPMTSSPTATASDFDSPKLEALVEVMFLAAWADGDLGAEERAQFARSVETLTDKRVEGAAFEALFEKLSKQLAGGRAGAWPRSGTPHRPGPAQGGAGAGGAGDGGRRPHPHQRARAHRRGRRGAGHPWRRSGRSGARQRRGGAALTVRHARAVRLLRSRAS